MRIFRIGDERHPIWDGTGAALIGGRWNSPGKPVIYGSLSYSCALLEILAHANIGRIPATQRFVVVEVPDCVAVESYDEHSLPPVGILKTALQPERLETSGLRKPGRRY